MVYVKLALLTYGVWTTEVKSTVREGCITSYLERLSVC